MVLKDDQTIFLVPITKKKFAQFTFMPDKMMFALLKDFDIPFESGKEPFKGKRLVRADRTKAIHYIIPIVEKKKVYHFYFMSTIIEKVFDRYKVPYYKNVEVSQVVADLKMEVQEINLHKTVNKKENRIRYRKKETNKDMNYRIKQAKAKLDNWYICHKLGMKYNVWVDVKTGKRNLAKDKLDQFLELVDPQRQEHIVQESEKRMIDEWYKKNQNKLDDKMVEFNVTGRTVAGDIGADSSTISVIKNKGPENSQISYLLYYYLQDENNRRNKSDKRKYKKRKNTVEVTPEIKEEEAATIDEIITEEEPKVETVAQESDAGSFVMNDGNLTVTNYSDTKKESSFKIDDAFKEYAKKVEEDNKELEKVVEKQEAVLCALRSRDNVIETLKKTNDELQREVNRYKYLIDLAMSKENTL